MFIRIKVAVLIFLYCGLIVLAVCLEYRASAGTYVCPPPPRVCIPDVKPPDCIEQTRPDCNKEIQVPTYPTPKRSYSLDTAK